jgi:hypothetical protein
MRYLRRSAALALPLVVANAWAEPGLAVSGYGTAAYTMTNTDQAEFARFNQVRGAANSPQLGVDSNLGVQTTVTANDWLSFTGQVLVRKLVKDSWRGEVYWAYAKAKVGPNFSVYVGRMAAPVFMISDYRNVGYANPMLRPPQEMYSQVPFDTVDGASASWQTGVGDTALTVQYAVGGTRQKLFKAGDTTGSNQEVKVSASNTLGLTAERGPLTARAGYSQCNITVSNAADVNALTSALRGAGAAYGLPQLIQLADALAINGKKASFTSLGLALDLEHVLVQAEAGRRKTGSIVPDSTSWYVMGGYRIGKLVPYVSYASLRSSIPVANSVPASCPAGVPAATCTQALAAAVNVALASGSSRQSTASAGLRWNFAQSAALKAQVDRVRPELGSGLLLNTAPGFHGGVTVYAVGVDFIF